MDRAGWNKILPIRRGRKPEEGKFKKALGEEDGAKKIAYSNRQNQINSITPLGDLTTSSEGTVELTVRSQPMYRCQIVS